MCLAWPVPGVCRLQLQNTKGLRGSQLVTGILYAVALTGGYLVLSSARLELWHVFGEVCARGHHHGSHHSLRE